MQMQNEIYEVWGHDWWSENAALDFSILRYCVNPLRYAYFKKQLQKHIVAGTRVLDVGCGGGFLSEEFARDGFTVTGMDPSTRSVQAARQHAAQSGLTIDYRIGQGEALPFPDHSFDIVACCDVLEHVEDLEVVMSEVSRTLKPGGIFCYDTVNRTWLSKLLLIKIWQEWPITRSRRPNIHVWEKFIKPAELTSLMKRNHMRNLDLKGILPKNRNPFSLLRSFRAAARGRLTGKEMAEKLGLCETSNLLLAYMGIAVKEPY